MVVGFGRVMRGLETWISFDDATLEMVYEGMWVESLWDFLGIHIVTLGIYARSI